MVGRHRFASLSHPTTRGPDADKRSARPLTSRFKAVWDAASPRNRGADVLAIAGNNGNGNGGGEPQLAFALGEAGAAAYQAGVLRGIAARFPHFRAPLLTGVSAGAINVAHLANHVGAVSAEGRRPGDGSVAALDFDDVFRRRSRLVVWRVIGSD